ncbi:unnamed protein product [Brachionus calyciflorus]|uniref:Uncharacterized protein n=1 Tax=Brachionus calyciflorus TaxID=104777 RepID=A0A814KGH4_9BILA|nr:unnamed protein product [Brachionus calyciflorus]
MSKLIKPVSESLSPVSGVHKKILDMLKVCALSSMGAFTIGYYSSLKNVKVKKCLFMSSLIGIGCGLITENSFKNLYFLFQKVAFGLATAALVCLSGYRFGEKRNS